MNKAANTKVSSRPPIRSYLFVPGNKGDWIDKSVSAGADALILDLEDSVPLDEKAAARGIVAGKITELGARQQRVYVRVNRTPYLYDFADITAVVGPGLEGIVVSKPCGPEDMHTVDMMLSEAELHAGQPVGSTVDVENATYTNTIGAARLDLDQCSQGVQSVIEEMRTTSQNDGRHPQGRHHHPLPKVS